jgi:hypothetical protein
MICTFGSMECSFAGGIPIIPFLHLSVLALAIKAVNDDNGYQGIQSSQGFPQPCHLSGSNPRSDLWISTNSLRMLRQWPSTRRILRIQRAINHCFRKLCRSTDDLENLNFLHNE